MLMPYIPKNQRLAIDAIIQPLIVHLRSLPKEKQDGALNYAVTQVLKQTYESSYFDYNRSMGVLSCIQAEWYRREISVYEDRKIIENGDL